MDNYEYLIAGLPVLSSDWSAQKHLSATALIDEIRSLSSDRDNALYDTLLSGYEEDNLTPDFYKSVFRITILSFATSSASTSMSATRRSGISTKGLADRWTRILSSRTKRDSRKPMWSGVSWKEPTC